MSRSAEHWQYQQEQENESGIDMHGCYHYHHPLNRGKEIDQRNYIANHDANTIPSAPNQQATKADQATD